MEGKLYESLFYRTLVKEMWLRVCDLGLGIAMIYTKLASMHLKYKDQNFQISNFQGDNINT